MAVLSTGDELVDVDGDDLDETRGREGPRALRPLNHTQLSLLIR